MGLGGRGVPTRGGCGASTLSSFLLAQLCLRARRMTEQCFRKCVAMYKDADLSVGEATCVDRCVHKYMTVHSKVQEVLGAHAQQQQAAAAAGQ